MKLIIPMPITTLLLRISLVCNLIIKVFIYPFSTKAIASVLSVPYSWFRVSPLRGIEKSSLSLNSLAMASSAPAASEIDPTELKRVFQMFDRNGDGQITKKELSDSFKNLGIYIPEGELTVMVDKMDVNGDGYVDIEEFGSLYQTIMHERDEDEDMREAFNVFDQNGDGYITVEELQSVLSSLGLKQGRTMEDCKQMIGKVDADGDGMVNFNEFKQMMRGGGFAALG